MEIDIGGLPLGLDEEIDPAVPPRRAGARLDAAEAWLDEDVEGIGRIAAEHRVLAPDLDPLREDLLRWRAPVEQEREALAGTLDRLAMGAGDSDDPDLRSRHGMLARTMVEEHAGSGLVDPGQAEALIGGYEARLSEADADRLVRRDPGLTRDLLADETAFPGLTPERRAQHRLQAEARVAAAPEDESFADGKWAIAGPAAMLAETARNRAVLGRRVAAGDASLADIAAAEAGGDLDARGAGTLRSRLTARHEAMVQAAAGVERVEAALRGGHPLDPGSPEDRAGIDAHYRGTRQGWEEAGLTPEEVRGELVDYLVDAAVVPATVSRRIGGIFRAGTPAERWEAADLIARLGGAGPGLLGQFDPEDVRIGLGVAALEKAGWPQEQAVARYATLQLPETDDPLARRDRRVIEHALGQVAAAPAEIPPAPLPKPAAPPRPPRPPGEEPTFPTNRTSALDGQQRQWSRFYDETAGLPGATLTERHALMMVLGQEGGIATDPVSKAGSGILDSTLKRLIDKGLLTGIRAGTPAADLTVGERARAYRAYFDDVLGTVGGGVALGTLPDRHSAAAFADVLFLSGRGGGARLIQRAVNVVKPGRLEVDGEMGPKTIEAFSQMASDPASRDRLLDALAEERRAVSGPNLYPRIDFYRPQNEAGRTTP